MINERYTIADIAKKYAIDKSEVRKHFKYCSGALKIPNERDILTWTIPESSISELEKRLDGSYRSASVDTSNVESSEEKIDKEKGGQGEENFQRKPLNVSGKESEKTITNDPLTILLIFLAVIGMIILMVSRGYLQMK